MDVVISELDAGEEKENLDLTILKPISVEELYTRVHNHIIELTDEEDELLYTAITHLPSEVRAYLYYKNNMIQFIVDHPFIQDLILRIYESVENLNYIKMKKNAKGKETSDPEDPAWLSTIPEKYQEEYKDKSAKDWNKFVNHQYFIDPNNPPEDILDTLKELNGYMMNYVYTRYMAFDRIYRLKNFKRGTVTVIDTDSNILSLDVIIRFLIERYFPNPDRAHYGRSFQNNIYISINMITYFITEAVTDILLSYGKYANIPEDYRSLYNMKNEFMFAMLVIGESKKRYISSILLREGNIMNPPKSDIKGFDFKKSTCSEYAEKRYKSIIENRVLYSDEIDVRGLLSDVYAFQDEVRQSILSGDKRFLPNGNAKELEGYKNPNSVQTVKAVTAWDIIYPERSIELPTKVSLLKMNIFTRDDIKDLRKTEPEIYEKIIQGIFEDQTGMFVTKEWIPTGVHMVFKKSKEWWKEIPEKYRKEYKVKGQKAWNQFVSDEYTGERSEDGYWEFKEKGLLVLAIPLNEDIPKWAIPYIDMDTLVNNILSPFIPVLKIFKNKTLVVGKNRNGVDRTTEGLSRVVKF